jgi:hypothetical protein
MRKFLVSTLICCALQPFAGVVAQEAAASRDTFRSDVSAISMQMDAKTLALTTIIQQLATCNAKSRFYRPGVAGADANGCVMPTAAPDATAQAIAKCNTSGKLYNPSSSAKDANGCVVIADPTAKKLAACNSGSKFYAPSSKSADSKGCLSVDAASLTYVGTFKSGRSTADFCVLNYVYFGTTSDNHAHECSIAGSPGSYTLTDSSVKGTTNCQMKCYNLK